MSKKSRSHHRDRHQAKRTLTCIVISASGRRYEVAPQWFNLQVRYKRLIQSSPLRARCAPGYDVHPDGETGALRLYDAKYKRSYPIPSQWAQVEREFILDVSGRSVSTAERQAAIDEECLFADMPEIVIRRGWIGEKDAA